MSRLIIVTFIFLFLANVHQAKAQYSNNCVPPNCTPTIDTPYTNDCVPPNCSPPGGSTNAENASSFLDDFLGAIPTTDGIKYGLDATPGDIISDLLPILFSLAGLILLGMLIMGGLQMMTSAGNPKGADAGKARLTSALIGFAIIFVAYWLTQFIEIIFGINIL